MRLGDRFALADRLVDLAVEHCSNTALPEVSRVMFSASRIGTPLETSVPRVRVVRATMFFSTNWPKIGIFSMNMSQPIAAGLELAHQLDHQPDADGDAPGSPTSS